MRKLTTYIVAVLVTVSLGYMSTSLAAHWFSTTYSTPGANYSKINPNNTLDPNYKITKTGELYDTVKNVTAKVMPHEKAMNILSNAHDLQLSDKAGFETKDGVPVVASVTKIARQVRPSNVDFPGDHDSQFTQGKLEAREVADLHYTMSQNPEAYTREKVGEWEGNNRTAAGKIANQEVADGINLKNYQSVSDGLLSKELKGIGERKASAAAVAQDDSGGTGFTDEAL